jgi:ribosomal protein S18 acetylase RimI-like enzyme
MSILIKKLTREDWQIFKKLRLQMLTEEPQAFTTTLAQVSSYTRDEWKKRVAGEHVAVLVLFVDGKPIGMNGLVYKEQEKGTVTIWGMFVKKEYRGRGFGTKLMHAVEKEIRKDHSVKTIKICVMACQIPAWELYKKQGFGEIGRDPGKKQFNDVVYDEIHMGKQI